MIGSFTIGICSDVGADVGEQSANLALANVDTHLASVFEPENFESQVARAAWLEKLHLLTEEASASAGFAGVASENLEPMDKAFEDAYRGLYLGSKREVQFLSDKRIIGYDDREELADALAQLAALHSAKELGAGGGNESLVLPGRAVAMLIPTSQMTRDNSGKGVVNGMTYGAKYGLCKEERFYDQLSAGVCTGFLIREDLVATARHCTESGASLTAIFDFVQDDAPHEVSAAYQVVGVVAQGAGDEDWAILRLSEAVSSRQTLKVAIRPPAVFEKLSMIGHPMGLPKKSARGAEVRALVGKTRFFANLDAYGGNSGSPVLASDGSVIGMLISGESDFQYRISGTGYCRESAVCPLQSCGKENVLRLSALAASLSALAP